MTNERALSSGYQAEVGRSTIYPVLFVELEFDDEFVRMWSGMGHLNWDGKAWTGVGTLLGIDPIQETNELQAVGTQVSLSGVESANLGLALTKDYQGRPARIWLGFFDGNGAVMADPYLLFEGKMDQMPIDEQGGTSTISVTVESHLRDLQRSRVRRFTNEDQQQEFPGDKGLEFVAGIQNQPITWGQGA